MTLIVAGEHNGKYILEANGHATGESQVCAAISGIIYSLYGYLINYGRADEITIKSGNAKFNFHGGKAARAAYRMALIGLMQIAEEYPNIVKIEGEPCL